MRSILRAPERAQTWLGRLDERVQRGFIEQVVFFGLAYILVFGITFRFLAPAVVAGGDLDSIYEAVALFSSFGSLFGLLAVLYVLIMLDRLEALPAVLAAHAGVFAAPKLIYAVDVPLFNLIAWLGLPICLVGAFGAGYYWWVYKQGLDKRLLGLLLVEFVVVMYGTILWLPVI